MNRQMPRILAIETTCDETAAAVFTEDAAVLSSVVASQADLHARYGGVVPEIASRAHLTQLLPVVDEALRQAKLGLIRGAQQAWRHPYYWAPFVLMGDSR